MKGKWALIRKAKRSGTQIVIGPFNSADEALAWAKANSASNIEHELTTAYRPEEYLA